ncbi:MAG TPA: P-II family nitrogen regulator [Clostridia bacterium]
MEQLVKMPKFELIYIIVNHGMGSKVLKKAKEYGMRGGTVFLGRGTVKNAFLEFFSLYDARKEIIIMGADAKTADQAVEALSKNFHFDKPNHGIAFTVSARNILGSTAYKGEESDSDEGANNPMYQLIITIVNKGKAEEVIDSATAAGAKGGTILNARGSGIHETSKVFNMEIEPEKETVLILCKADVTKAIVESIYNNLELGKPGNGIIFVQDVNSAYGIYEA